MLSSALNQAVRWRLIERNVCKDVTPPRVPPPEIQPLSLEEANHFLAAAEGDKFEALYVLALNSGMRLGELGGLFWSDIDLPRRVLHVQRSLITSRGVQTLEAPKTPGSRRNISLTARAVDASYATRSVDRPKGSLYKVKHWYSRMGRANPSTLRT